MLAGGGRTVPTPSTESRDRADSGPQGRDERCTSSLLKAETAASDFRSSGALPTEVQLPTPLATGSGEGPSDETPTELELDDVDAPLSPSVRTVEIRLVDPRDTDALTSPGGSRESRFVVDPGSS